MRELHELVDRLLRLINVSGVAAELDALAAGGLVRHANLNAAADVLEHLDRAATRPNDGVVERGGNHNTALLEALALHQLAVVVLHRFVDDLCRVLDVLRVAGDGDDGRLTRRVAVLNVNLAVRRVLDRVDRRALLANDRPDPLRHHFDLLLLLIGSRRAGLLHLVGLLLRLRLHLDLHSAPLVTGTLVDDCTRECVVRRCGGQ